MDNSFFTICKKAVSSDSSLNHFNFELSMFNLNSIVVEGLLEITIIQRCSLTNIRGDISGKTVKVLHVLNIRKINEIKLIQKEPLDTGSFTNCRNAKFRTLIKLSTF